MPADPAVVFDAFHHQHWRPQWDTLVRHTRISGAAQHPYVGALTESDGAGLLGALAMRTRFVSYTRPQLAAAAMVGEAFPFRARAASMKHVAQSPGQSLLVYTYTFEVKPRALAWLLEPLVRQAFDAQTRKRFARLADFVRLHGAEIEQWQRQQTEQA